MYLSDEGGSLPFIIIQCLEFLVTIIMSNTTAEYAVTVGMEWSKATARYAVTVGMEGSKETAIFAHAVGMDLPP